MLTDGIISDMAQTKEAIVNVSFKLNCILTILPPACTVSHAVVHVIFIYIALHGYWQCCNAISQFFDKSTDIAAHVNLI